MTITRRVKLRACVLIGNGTVRYGTSYIELRVDRAAAGNGETDRDKNDGP